MKAKVTAFVPCRAGSERVKNKNTRDFAGIKGGLCAIKLGHLATAAAVDEIVVSSNDPLVLDIARRFAASAAKSVRLVERPDHLSASSTSIDDLTLHACDVVGEGAVAWAHVTSPFVNAEQMDAMINAYHAAVEVGSHDSLMAVNKIQKFLWTKDGAFNYSRTPRKWPRTQDLPPLYEVNSATFIADVALCRRLVDRIGERPMFYELNQWAAVDVDWEDDFRMAEILYKGVVGAAAQ